MAMDALPEVEIPALKQMGKLADSQAKSKTKGFEVGYDLFAINGRMLGHGDPIRVKQGERVSAIVEMNHPGIWVIGDLEDDDRKNGMGIVVEYAGQQGKPQWQKPKSFRWDYTRFGRSGAALDAVHETPVQIAPRAPLSTQIQQCER